MAKKYVHQISFTIVQYVVKNFQLRSMWNLMFNNHNFVMIFLFSGLVYNLKFWKKNRKITQNIQVCHFGQQNVTFILEELVHKM